MTITAIRWSCAGIPHWALPASLARSVPETSRWPMPWDQACSSPPHGWVSCRQWASACWASALLLPEVATWWCGERPALDYVLANLDHVVIKPTYPNQNFEPIFGRDTRGAARDELLARLRNRPYAYVAQEHVQLSRAPVWRASNSTDLVSRALTIRVYACKTRDGVHVMPGGLARIAQPDAADVVSSQRGGGAKDIWVLHDGPEPVVQATPAWLPEQRRNDVPSRLVENLYWLGRYSVRCEGKLRLLRGALAHPGDSALRRHAVQLAEAMHAIVPDDKSGTGTAGSRPRHRESSPISPGLPGTPPRCETGCRFATGVGSWPCNGSCRRLRCRAAVRASIASACCSSSRHFPDSAMPT